MLKQFVTTIILFHLSYNGCTCYRKLIEKNSPSTASSLVFIKREGKLYLFQVWNAGSMNGAQVASALDKQTNDRRRQTPTLVTLKVDDH